MKALFTMMQEMKNEAKSAQEGMSKGQEEMKNVLEEVKNGQEEMKNEIVDIKEEMKKEVMDVRDEIKDVKKEVKDEIKDVKEVVDKEIHSMKENMEALNKRIEEWGRGREEDDRHIRPAPLTTQMVTSPGLARMKPPTFDGTSPWSTYHRQFEAAATANRWGKDEKATALVLALRGDASNVLQTITFSQQQDYEAVVRQMERRYGDKHLQQVYQAQLKARVQKVGESIQVFESDIARLVRQAYPTAPDDFLEQLAVQSFIDGLRDCEAQQALRLARAKNLGDVLAHALEFEAAKQASRGHLKIRQLHAVDDASGDVLQAIRDQIKSLESKLLDSRSGSGRNDRQPIRCWTCGERGHLKRQCNLSESQQQGAYRPAKDQEN